ncbi:hypothetical protein DCO58_04870 [Helicobacter saguini]|uniref:Outer membrane protein beta-barrel domain-containing protein n=1 Tax=Helicobacter saguini TaxID=1548018 RepID=A0A347VSY2_9HELI|nr:hypothetical protein [Helicobacter saguini]MWV62319.1 hypothetical protein [Helicobacter saguini]MWV67010.1 hypothetical protein [Helicobacter saguini]MWV69358.1 hypothetical protein [Helicobacter saguini]MWV71087.1 hypothetical protein [Helicobacter saguini]TLD95015.1 hypothetical protein LS64_003635 [Helicobacter saguini]
MKKLSVSLCGLLLCGSLAHAAGHGFVGANLGVWGQYSVLNIGVLGGYHYYLPGSMQTSGLRQGIRGYGAVNWAVLTSAFFHVGVDYTIDFTPKSRYVWGAFGGFSLGGIAGSGGGFGYSVNVGGSLEMHNRHRFELSLGWGYQFMNLRYIFKL